MKLTIFTLSAAAGLAVMAALPANAATVTCGKVTYGLIQDGIALTGVCGTDNNDFAANVNLVSPAPGGGVWVLADKSDDAGSGNQEAMFANPVPASGQTTWAVLNPFNYPSLLVTLKQSNTYATFALDMTKALSGTWSTSGPGKSVNDLSHASVFVSGEPAPIPVPAAGFLLVTAVGGLAALRRRKNRA